MPEPVLVVHHVAVVDEDILGPGRRLVIWTAGCPFRCNGCIEEPLQSIDAGTPWAVEELLDRLHPYLEALGAVTFTGGEPLLHRRALFRFLRLARTRWALDTMLYTGHATRVFREAYRAFHPLVDLCVTGPFVESRHGDHLWRGSGNQELVSPSGRYGRAQLARWSRCPSAGLQLHFDPESCYAYGIPPPGLEDRLVAALGVQGVVAGGAGNGQAPARGRVKTVRNPVR